MNERILKSAFEDYWKMQPVYTDPGLMIMLKSTAYHAWIASQIHTFDLVAEVSSENTPTQ